MNSHCQRYLACAQLNLHMLALVCRNRWLSSHNVATSYDRLASGYDEAWLVYLKPVTDALLAHLPDHVSGRILDLGCGTGYTSVRLAERFVQAQVEGVDISTGMLERARRRRPHGRIAFRRGDLLERLRGEAEVSVDLILSAWALGYSRPAAAIAESARVLVEGGTLAFVVNRLDTLGPVFRAFRTCMAEFPGEVRMALWPKHPRSWRQLARILNRAGFTVEWCEEGTVWLPMPSDMREARNWLLRTGVLAGFDTVLPLAQDGPVAERFDRAMAAGSGRLGHHYISVVARRR